MFTHKNETHFCRCFLLYVAKTAKRTEKAQGQGGKEVRAAGRCGHHCGSGKAGGHGALDLGVEPKTTGVRRGTGTEAGKKQTDSHGKPKGTEIEVPGTS